MSQEEATWTAHGLFCRNPPPSKKFCLATLQHAPELLDLLLECGLIPRRPCYPETQADSTATEVVAAILHFPLDVVPGVSVTFPRANVAEEMESERDAMKEILRIFLGRAGWVERLVAVWTKIEQEKWQSVKPCVKSVIWTPN